MTGVSSTFTSPVILQGAASHLTFDTVTTPGVEQTLFNVTVPATKTNTLYAVYIDSRTEGRCIIYHGADKIGSFRVGPANPTGSYVFYLPYAVPEGDVFQVKFTAVSGTPAVDLSAFVQMTE